jgi:3',5'-cyclic AMP phosphodiesterase CpdA
MLTLLHASDLHFGKHFDPDAARALRESVDSIAPDLIALSGDFTQRAKTGEFKQAQAFLLDLPDIPTVVTPGNHDVPLYRIWERLFSPLRNYREYIASELDAVLSVPGATVVSLNSTSPHGAIVNGTIGDRQLRFAAETFRNAPEGDLRVLVTHHNLAPAPDYVPEQVMPRNRTRLQALSAMKVELVLAGHLHRCFLANSRDLVPGSESGDRILLVQSGTTTSHRGRGREAGAKTFNTVGVTGTRIEVTRFLYSVEDRAFLPTSIHTFPRGGGRALLDSGGTGSSPEKGGEAP